MKAGKYGACPRCKRKLQLNAKGNLRPHAKPKEMRKDPKVHEACKRGEA